jgi:3-deoxy-manno-octulosonate cytidylyltransferase (CMP-KDO synthetase)
MGTVIVIPARYASRRLEGKPLQLIAGRTLVRRVWDIARAVKGVDGVYVATDDRRIADHVQSFGGAAIMTPETCSNGTERVLAAARKLTPTPSHVLNLQGDAVLTPPWVVERLVEAMAREPELVMVTAAVRLRWEAYQEFLETIASGRAGGTMVTVDRLGNALYFSKGPIPFVRRDSSLFGQDAAPLYRHVGIYGYRLDTLRRYLALPPGPLERAEKLEQLRALEHGIPLRVLKVDYRGRTDAAVDNLEDVGRVEAIIAAEGEILDALR